MKSPRVSEVSVGGRPRALPDRTVREVVEAVLAREGRSARISVTFVGRDGMRRLNRDYKDRDAPTDVLAFPLEGPGGLVGDIYVCPWIARREAVARRVPVRQELIRNPRHEYYRPESVQHRKQRQQLQRHHRPARPRPAVTHSQHNHEDDDPTPEIIPVLEV